MLATRLDGDGDCKVDSRGLDLSGRDGRLLVVGSKLGSLGSDALEDVVDERVQDGHGTVGYTGVGVDLLEDCCDAWGQHVLEFWGGQVACRSRARGDSATDECDTADAKRRVLMQLTLVDVGGVGLLASLGALLLVARSGGLLAGILLLRSLGGGGGGLGGGLLVCGLGRHFGDVF